MRLKGSAAFLESRRRWALKLLADGLSLHEVGRRLGCSPSSVLRWHKAHRHGGEKAPQVRFSPGRPPKLDRRQQRRLLRLLLEGAPAHGYPGDVLPGLGLFLRGASRITIEFSRRLIPLIFDHILAGTSLITSVYKHRDTTINDPSATWH